MEMAAGEYNFKFILLSHVMLFEAHNIWLENMKKKGNQQLRQW